MSFSLTESHVDSILGPASHGDWSPFLSALTDDVDWQIGSPYPTSKVCMGFFNKAGWLEKINRPLLSRLKDRKLQMTTEHLYVLPEQNMAIAECSGKGVQMNGNLYEQVYAWFLIFDKKGRIVKIREYLNTQLLVEVYETNP